MEKECFFEFLGTMILVFLGSSVGANVILKRTFGNGMGWGIISLGWGFAFFIAAIISAPFSGAHLNPAVTIALAITGGFKGNIIGYIVAQFLGAFLGSVLTFILYKKHFDIEDNPNNILGVFSTRGAIDSRLNNFLGEFMGTFVLILVVFFSSMSSVNTSLTIGILIAVIGVSIGGVTGFAINPARDLGPRIIHYFLPIKNKGGSNWKYAWIPVIAPIIGAITAALLFIGAQNILSI